MNSGHLVPVVWHASETVLIKNFQYFQYISADGESAIPSVQHSPAGQPLSNPRGISQLTHSIRRTLDFPPQLPLLSPVLGCSDQRDVVSPAIGVGGTESTIAGSSGFHPVTEVLSHDGESFNPESRPLDEHLIQRQNDDLPVSTESLGDNASQSRQSKGKVCRSSF